MLNMANVASAATKLTTNTTLLSQGVVSTTSMAKSSWQVMVQGAFSLLFPDIHRMFGTRLEMKTWLTIELNKAFLKHHATNTHIWAAQPQAPGYTDISNITIPTFFPQEVFLLRQTQVVAIPVTVAVSEDAPDVNLSVPSFQFVEAWMASPANVYLNT